MIYTIGNERNYRDAIRQYGSNALFKEVDGYAFQTIEDAQKRIDEEGQRGKWIVWGLNAEWGRDTKPAIDGWWHVLTRQATLIDVTSHNVTGLLSRVVRDLSHLISFDVISNEQLELFDQMIHVMCSDRRVIDAIMATISAERHESEGI